MGATGIVPDHATQRALGMCRGVWSEREPIKLSRITQIIEHHTRLHTSKPVLRIDLDNMMHVFGHVDHYRNVTTLSGEARPPSTWKHRRTILTTCRYSLDHI